MDINERSFEPQPSGISLEDLGLEETLGACTSSGLGSTICSQ